MPLARRIRETREARGWSQEQLGEAAALSTNTIKGYERGLIPSQESYAKLARAMPELDELPTTERPRTVVPGKRDSRSGEFDIDIVLGDGQGRAYARSRPVETPLAGSLLHPIAHPKPQPSRADLERPGQVRDRADAGVGHATEADLKHGLLAGLW